MVGFKTLVIVAESIGFEILDLKNQLKSFLAKIQSVTDEPGGQWGSLEKERMQRARPPAPSFLVSVQVLKTLRREVRRFGGDGTRRSWLDLGVSTQAVELIRGLVTLARTPLTEAGGDLIEGPALRLRHLEVGEDEEED